MANNKQTKAQVLVQWHHQFRESGWVVDITSRVELQIAAVNVFRQKLE